MNNGGEPSWQLIRRVWKFQIFFSGGLKFLFFQKKIWEFLKS